MSTQFPNGIEIFRAGRHTDNAGTARDFTDADIHAIAAGYSAAKHEAPIVVGHPELDSPAYGWVDSVRAESASDGARLVIDARDVEPQFAEMVKTRRFPKRSAAFYAPDHPSNPTPGQWYLRHVGFLGATPPAISGLKPIQFSDVGESINFFLSTEDLNVTEQEQELERLRTQIAQRDEALAAANARADESQRQVAAFAEARRADQHAAHVTFAEAEVNAGRLMPKERASTIAVLDVLADAAAVEFAEGDAKKTVSPVEFVKSLITARPPGVQFGEHAPGSVAVQTGKPKTDAELDAAARRLAAEKGISFAEAAHQIIKMGE
ncbi:MAG: hypothetical protein LBE22_07645 [Azoarcus sp.]|nr:hypothetical protein [Azoarcus sp.]